MFVLEGAVAPQANKEFSKVEVTGPISIQNGKDALVEECLLHVQVQEDLIVGHLAGSVRVDGLEALVQLPHFRVIES